MKARFVLACAAASLALMAIGANNSSAEGVAEEPYAAIGIDDRVIEPGQEVRVAASCQTAEFAGSAVVSPVVTAPDLVRDKGKPADSVLFSMGRIAEDAAPGTYPISFTCADREVTGEFTVVAGAVAEVPAEVTEEVTAKVTAEPEVVPVAAQVPATQKSAPEAGSPSAAPVSDRGDSAGVVIGAGAVALLVAGGVGVLAYRRRRV